MIRRGLGRFILFTLIFFGAISLVGRWSYNAGWTNGYFDNQVAQSQAAAAEDAPPAAVAPAPMPYGYSYHRPGISPIGWFFGGLIKFFLFLMLAGFLFRLFVGRRWRHGHDQDGGWGKRPFAHHHSCGHRHNHNTPHEKRPEDVEPDIRTA